MPFTEHMYNIYMTENARFHNRFGAGDSTSVSESELQSVSESAISVSGIGLAENEA